jgi:hypothetical protein
MRHRLAVIILGAALGVGTRTASAAQAAPVTEANLDGARCVVAGVTFLRENGLLRAAALRQIDYSTLADPEDGPIYTSLPEGSYLSLGTVVRLHHTNPALFEWCR